MALDADEGAMGPRVRTLSSPLATMRNADAIFRLPVSHLGYDQRCRVGTAEVFGHDVAAAVKPEEFGESTIE
jgi:hypothetical protein